jgi:protein O-GlcNAc transferase
MEQDKTTLSLAEATQLALGYHQAGQLEQAEQVYRQILSQNPQHSDTLHVLGVIAYQQGNFDVALPLIQQAITLHPEEAHYYNNLGLVLKAQGRDEEAIQAFQKALAFNPHFADVLYNLGSLMMEQGKLENACQYFEKALTMKPEHLDTLNSLGVAHMEQGHLDAALHYYQEVLKIQPDHLHALNNMGNALRYQGWVKEALVFFEQASTIEPHYQTAHHNFNFVQQYLPDITLAKLHATHIHWNNCCAVPLKKYWGDYTNQRSADKRLVLGFVSGDFRQHSVASFTMHVFEQLAQHCDLICYANQPECDDETSRFQQAASQWWEVNRWSDQQLAQRIRDDKVDILFDLSGHTARNRLNMFAQKPAPIQIAWVGYTATTGLEAMDYIISDPYLIPVEAEPYYQEQVIRLPHCSICYEPPSTAPDISPLPALQNRYITFASFNILTKLNPIVIATWTEILKALPESQLLIKARGLNCPGTRQRYLDLFQAHGVASNRILCQAPSKYAEFLTYYQQVDIQLDPFPFSGGTTTMESLWMGVPVITLPGETFASRQSMRNLSNIGLTDFIAQDTQHYVKIAVDWASRIEKLAEIRMQLRSKVQQSPLSDAPRFTQDLLQELRGIWTHWCQK